LIFAELPEVEAICGGDIGNAASGLFIWELKHFIRRSPSFMFGLSIAVVMI
jgi:hypothetical protein